MHVELVAAWRCLFLSGSADLWIRCYQQRIRYLTICDLTICNLTICNLTLVTLLSLPYFGGTQEVSIFERIYGSVDSLLSTADPLPYRL